MIGGGGRGDGGGGREGDLRGIYSDSASVSQSKM